jgi:hypothetical protein
MYYQCLALVVTRAFPVFNFKSSCWYGIDSDELRCFTEGRNRHLEVEAVEVLSEERGGPVQIQGL